MSDCFDHEADAWDSLNDGYDEPVKPMREFEPVGYINEMEDAIIIANLPVQYRRKHMSLMARADTYGYAILYVKS